MRIGWYVHHHGSGHRTRMSAVRGHLDGVVVLSTLEAPADGSAWVRPPRDDDGEPRTRAPADRCTGRRSGTRAYGRARRRVRVDRTRTT